MGARAFLVASNLPGPKTLRANALRTTRERLATQLAAEGIIGGHDLSRDYPELGHALLTCATETRTSADIEYYARSLGRLLGRQAAA